MKNPLLNGKTLLCGGLIWLSVACADGQQLIVMPDRTQQPVALRLSDQIGASSAARQPAALPSASPTPVAIRGNAIQVRFQDDPRDTADDRAAHNLAGDDLAGDDRADASADSTSSGADDDLPQVADVSSPISWAPLSLIPQNDPSALLTTAPLPVVEGNRLRYGDLTGTLEAIPSLNWEPIQFGYGRTYFEDPSLERYGVEASHQNVLSAAKFYGTVPTLPFQMIRDHYQRDGNRRR